MGGMTTLDSYGPGRYLDLIPEEHHEFLGRCRDYFETETHIFVHANYFPDLPMDEQPVGMLRWASLREMTPARHESGKVVIVGHTSQKNGEILDLGHLQCIDTSTSKPFRSRSDRYSAPSRLLCSASEAIAGSGMIRRLLNRGPGKPRLDPTP
jgi:hypothetical protein